jgi:hypothetical protein
LWIVLLGYLGVASASLDRISNQDAIGGLKAALEKGSQVAVSTLGRSDGFFGDGRVRIPLPPSAQRVEKLMRGVGMGKHADELILTLNRAAEAAVPEARALFLDAVKKMSVRDANLDAYVTQKALDGLFFMVAEEEKRIRKDPVKAGSDILRKVFGALK